MYHLLKTTCSECSRPLSDHSAEQKARCSRQKQRRYSGQVAEKSPRLVLPDSIIDRPWRRKMTENEKRLSPDSMTTGYLVKQIANFKFSSLEREKLISIFNLLTSGTTKVCPTCLNIDLLLLETNNLKICPDCNTRVPWKLESGQKSRLANLKYTGDGNLGNFGGKQL
jgi:hypothetical protein